MAGQPDALRADTSTEILLLARASAPELLAAEEVGNNHYDTDGLLSVALALRPELASRGRELRDLAWAGDLSRYPSEQAVRLDLILSGFAEHPASPIASELARMSELERLQRTYDYALGHLDEVLDGTAGWPELWREELERIEQSRHWLRSGAAQVERHPEIELAVLRSPKHLHRVAVREAAPFARTLEIAEEKATLTYAIDTWFHGATLSRARRHSLGQFEEAWLGADPALVVRHRSRESVLWPELTAFTANPQGVIDATLRAQHRLDAHGP